MIIDFHAHILPPPVIDEIRKGRFAPAVAIGKDRSGRDAVLAKVRVLGQEKVAFGHMPAALIDMDVRVDLMKDMGVDRQILSAITDMTYYGLDAGLNKEISALYNDEMAKAAAKAPEKFHCMANVPLQEPPAAAAELERCVKRGHVGVKIGTNVAGMNLHDRSLDVFWAMAESLDVPVFIHPGDIIGAKDRMEEFHLRNLIANPLDTTIAASCLIFGGVLDRFPKLEVILAHLGGFTPWIRGRLAHGYKVREEPKSGGAAHPDAYLSRLHYDTVIHNADCLEFAVKTIGADSLLYGTDYPWDVGDLGPAVDIPGLSHLSRADQEKILAGNTKRLYKI